MTESDMNVALLMTALVSDFRLKISLRFTLVLLSVKLVSKEITERRKDNEFLGKG